MTALAAQSLCENAAPTAHRIDLHIGSQDRQFLTALLGQDPGDNRHPINGWALEAAESQKLEPADGALRPLHPHATAGHNTFRKGISAQAPSC
jgi:hypothetical protein